jgi:hypothetical protein
MGRDDERLVRRRVMLGRSGGAALASALAMGCLALVTSPAALAGPPSAVSQYIETVPTGGGSHPVTPSGQGSRLSPALARRIEAEGGPYAAMIRKIAGSGAPDRSLSGGVSVSPSAARNANVVTAAFHSGSAGDTFFVVLVGLGLVVGSVFAAHRWRTGRGARVF